MGMTIKDLVNVLPYYFNNKITPFLWGKHGVGKSQCIKQFAEANGLEFIDIRLGQFEVGDLLGIPTIRDGVTEYAMPKWLQMALKGNCIILWDEINRAKIDVIQAVFQAVLDRQMHLFKFPETTYQICASNPNIDEYVVTDIADAAFMSRFGHVVLVPSAKDWIGYAEDKNFHASVVDVVRADPAMFGEHECEMPIELRPNPRAWEFISRFAKHTETTTKEKFLNKELPTLTMSDFQEVAKGFLGVKACAAYFEQLNATDKPVPAKDILSKYSKVKEKVLFYAGHEGAKVRQDLLKVSLENCIKTLTKTPLAELPKEQLDNFMDFLDDLPNDLAFAGIRDLAMNKTTGGDWQKYFSSNDDLCKRVNKISNGRALTGDIEDDKKSKKKSK